MQIKEMRQYLKNKVDKVPRSNADVELLYNKLQPIGSRELADRAMINDEDEYCAPDESYMEPAGEVWTYIGGGVSPPHTTKYMGIQHFIRGVPTRVTDPRVLEKIGSNRCFAKGEVDMDYYFEQEELEAKRLEGIREEGLKMQIMIERENRKG